MKALLVAAACLLGGCGSCRGDADVDASGGTKEAPKQTAGWSVEPNTSGQAVVRFNHATATEYNYVFWREAFAWAGPRFTAGTVGEDGSVTFAIEVESLGLSIDGSMRATDERTLAVTWKITATKAISGIEGGGIDFRLRPTPTLVKGGAKKPELLPGDGGFRWPVGGNAHLEVAFEGEMARVFFEKGRPEAIRALFIGDTITPGTRTVTMTIGLPESGRVMPPLAQRYGAPDGSWKPQVMTWETTPVDLSQLNHPVGTHGPVRVKGDALVFEDGTPARFWGANVAAGALFYTQPDVVKAQAKRLAALGFNLARIHHHDDHWVQPNVLDPKGGLNEESLRQVDWWVKCLEDEGIYVWMDLHVGRAFTGVDAIEELAGHKGQGHGFNYVNPSIEAKMAEFAKAYFDRKNAHTGVRYVDDPGVIGVLVTNENDLTYHGVRFFAAGAPKHLAMLRERATPIIGALGLPAGPAMQLKKPGPAKILLAELEARFSRRAVEQLRGFGWKGPVATTNYWGKAPLHTLAPLLLGDIVDAHSYGDAEFLRKSPFFEPNFLTWIAAAQLAGTPTTVTEWAVPWPARDRFAAPLFLAGVASLQEWDALTFFVYSQHPIPPPQKPVRWSALQDPGALAMLPAAAVAYRGGHIAPAKKTYRLELTEQTLYGQPTSPQSSTAIRTLAEQSRLEIGLPDLPKLDWDTPRQGRAGATPVTDPTLSFLPADATAVTSDTGELRRDWATEIHTIDTPKTQAAQGWIGGQTIELANVELAVTTPKASIALTALDDQPLGSSKRILLTVVSQVVASAGDTFPLLSQPVTGELRLEHTAPALQLVPLHDAAAPLQLSKEGDQHVIALPEAPTHWFLVVPVGA